jgi:hypothetical protein
MFKFCFYKILCRPYTIKKKSKNENFVVFYFYYLFFKKNLYFKKKHKIVFEILDTHKYEK